MPTMSVSGKLKNTVKKVRAEEAKLSQISDEELAGLTEKFRERYKKGESLDRLLPEAFAAISEADFRVLGMRPFDVQIMAGAALHYGYMAEMNTGEGKTLSATLPLYLNALTDRPCYLVTTNEYLADRDGKEMGQVYEFMGLTCGYPSKFEEGPLQRKQLYSSDIIYVTNFGICFDYLFNNLVKKAEERFIQDMYFAVVDEADAVLLDSAVMPLIISGAPRVQSNLYGISDFFVTTLTEGREYIKEKKSVWLTPEGVEYAEKFFGIDNFYSRKDFEINRQVTLALRAHTLYENNIDYIVTEENKVELFDSATGRLMTGVKLRGGQHQAIEAKEKTELTNESKTLASITYQNLFMQFEKFAGMSGTIMDSRDEFFDVYHKRVIKIPTNRPIIRKDLKDRYYHNAEEQFAETAKRVTQIHSTGQPVLVVLNNVTDTDIFSKLMLQENIPHNVLNASNAFWEAEIIKGAGQKGAVTVATPMAGRGTDIKLGEGVDKLGGLAVIVVGRMSSVRSERQARGRAGRQGDPGLSEFFISLEDEVVAVDEDDKRMQKYIEGSRHISRHGIRKIVNGARKSSDEEAVSGRRRSVVYDDVLKRQRNFIYETRNSLLDGANIPETVIYDIAIETVGDFLKANKKLTRRELNRYILDNISYTLDEEGETVSLTDRDELTGYLLERVKKGLRAKKKQIGNRDIYEQFVREATLTAVDDGWVDLIDYLEQLQYAVAGRSSAQRNVVFEYQNEAFESYRDTEKRVKRNILRNLMLSEVSTDRKNASPVIVYP